MVAVMVIAPVQMAQEGHSLRVVGLVISLHVTGMFAPAPLTGRLTDRFGPLPVAIAGAVLLTAGAALSAASGHVVTAFALALLLIGLGWNAGLIAGSTLLASTVAVDQLPRVEAVGELSMGIAAATGTAAAGPVVGLAGYATLAIGAAVAAAALGPLLVALTRHGPRRAVPAKRLLASRRRITSTMSDSFKSPADRALTVEPWSSLTSCSCSDTSAGFRWRNCCR